MDRREFVRVPRKFRVEVQDFVFPLAQQKPTRVECADISAGGLRIICSRRFAEEHKVQVKVFIPSFNKFHSGFFKVFESDVGQYLQAVAEVAWVREAVPLTSYETGLRFVDVYEDDWLALRKMILAS
ncbi:MAG: PilZ domain-containing protein [Desulfonatronovibrionaceae bacterium]